jgi:hypothetical protein
MGHFNNPYGLYKRSCSITLFKVLFPRTRRLYYLPNRKDYGLNAHYNLFRFYALEHLNIILNSS